MTEILVNSNAGNSKSVKKAAVAAAAAVTGTAAAGMAVSSVLENESENAEEAEVITGQENVSAQETIAQAQASAVQAPVENPDEALESGPDYPEDSPLNLEEEFSQILEPEDLMTPEELTIEELLAQNNEPAPELKDVPVEEEVAEELSVHEEIEMAMADKNPDFSTVLEPEDYMTADELAHEIKEVPVVEEIAEEALIEDPVLMADNVIQESLDPNANNDDVVDFEEVGSVYSLTGDDSSLITADVDSDILMVDADTLVVEPESEVDTNDLLDNELLAQAEDLLEEGVSLLLGEDDAASDLDTDLDNTFTGDELAME